MVVKTMSSIQGAPQDSGASRIDLGARATPSKQTASLRNSQSVNQSFKQIADYNQLQEKLQETPLENVTQRNEITAKILSVIKNNPVLKEHFESIKDNFIPPQQVFQYNHIPEAPQSQQIQYSALPGKGITYGTLPPAPRLNYGKLPPEYEIKDPQTHFGLPDAISLYSNAISKYKNIQTELKSATINMYTGAYKRLEKGENPEIVRSDLYENLNHLREKANEKLSEQFEVIKQEAGALAQTYNQAVGRERENTKTNINLFNRAVAEMNVGDSSTQALHYQMTAFQAVVERRCLEKKSDDAPTHQEMSQIAARMQEQMKEPNQILSSDQIKEKFALPEALQWGQEKASINNALSNPMNWTNKLGVAIKMSQSGKAHAAATEISPLGLSESGGVPSGLRKENTRPVNLQHTKTYFVGADGEPIADTVHESFRGGVFPTAAAAKTAVTHMENKLGRPLTSLHVNALLTPVRGLFALKKKDDKLLKDHSKNMEAALGDKAYLSNFGVNEGAVGKVKVGPITLPAAMGWHTSIAYTNNAAVKFSQALQARIEGARSNPALRDRMVAIVQLGQDMQAVWANNDFARGDVGNNQFKLPAMWKAMDALLDVDNYLDCMSGKDRTSEVAANAQSMLDEIHMNLMEKKEAVRGKLAESLTPAEVDAYASPILNDSDIIRLRLASDNEREAVFIEIIDDKTKAAQAALGGKEGLMAQKKTIGKGIAPGMMGIPTQKALSETPLSPVLSGAGTFVPTGPYNKSKNASFARQREAVNRRLDIQAATIGVTQQNTGVMGMKVKLTQAVVLGTCGFDIGFVNLALKAARPEDRADVLVEHAGLNEIDEKSRQAFLKELQEDKQDYSKLLMKLAKRKAASFKPPIHVSG